MVKKISIVLVIIFSFINVALTYNIFAPNKYNVTFIYNNGEENLSLKVTENSKLTEPESPEKENSIFSGWYTDITYTEKYKFSDKINSDITLYANWNPDYVKITNYLSNDILKANISIRNLFINEDSSKAGIYVLEDQATGSGIIFEEDSNYYYALTNNHVVVNLAKDDNFLYIIDSFGNKSRGTLIYSDADYDLAVVRFFKKEGYNLYVANIAEKNPSISDDLICMGTYNQQANTITYGNVEKYDYIDISIPEVSTFSKLVLFHNCPIQQGSSGGALLDINFNIVGINYASSSTDKDVFIQGFAIPSESIIRFLMHYYTFLDSPE